MAEKSTYSIAEWYGRNITKIPAVERQRLAKVTAPKTIGCPFSEGGCNKPGGVCSIRPFSKGHDGDWTSDGFPAATCPRRFKEKGIVTEWVSEVILSEGNPEMVTEVPFLAGVSHEGEPTGKNVGKIDMVLVVEDSDPLNWCAVEIQAVYFSGKNMAIELSHLKVSHEEGVPVPQGQRHPDFRSCGPKRLMPQLQTKVPSISRWGHKMAVVIDRAFWESLSPMGEVDDVSNCDIAWFVVDYEEKGEQFSLKKGACHLTTLTRAVEGLTAGTPVAKSEFEDNLRKKLKRKSR